MLRSNRVQTDQDADDRVVIRVVGPVRQTLDDLEQINDKIVIHRCFIELTAVVSIEGETLTQLVGRDLLDARHLIEQLHQPLVQTARVVDSIAN